MSISITQTESCHIDLRKKVGQLLHISLGNLVCWRFPSWVLEYFSWMLPRFHVDKQHFTDFRLFLFDIKLSFRPIRLSKTSTSSIVTWQVWQRDQWTTGLQNCKMFFHIFNIIQTLSSGCREWKCPMNDFQSFCRNNECTILSREVIYLGDCLQLMMGLVLWVLKGPWCLRIIKNNLKE